MRLGVCSGRQTSHIFRTDLPPHGVEGGGQTKRGSPFISKVVQKHPVWLSSGLLYTQTRRVGEQEVRAISFRPPHGIDRAVNFSRGGWKKNYLLIFCQSLFWGGPLTQTQLVSEGWRAHHLVILCCVSSVLPGAGTHCCGHDADGTTYLQTHNSLLVCQACDLCNNSCVKCRKDQSLHFSVQVIKLWVWIFVYVSSGV